MLRFRDQFITLIHSVKAVIMNRMSKSMEEFFCSEPKEYRLGSLSMFTDKEDSRSYTANRPLYFSKIVRLFPKAEELSISGKNWDWSLNRFIEFLKSYDFDFHGLALKYINIEIDEKEAQQRLLGQHIDMALGTEYQEQL